MIDDLKKYNEVHVFAIVINGESPRFDQNRKQMVKKFQDMFGEKFLEKNTIIVVTHWSYDERSVNTRKRTKKDEKTFCHEINKILREEFGMNPSITVPTAFIDVKYGGGAQEKPKFDEGMAEIENCLNTFPAYPCKNFKYPETNTPSCEPQK